MSAQQTGETDRSRTTQPVGDTVPKIDNELAVGEDLHFQRKWWGFERAVWWFFSLILVVNAAGLLGRGPLAKAKATSSDGSMQVDYERIERFDTPSILRVKFGPNAIRDGKLQLWMSESLIRNLGNQRVVPQPLSSVLDTGGLTYTFPAQRAPAIVEFALQPNSPGLNHLRLRSPGCGELQLSIFVVP